MKVLATWHEGVSVLDTISSNYPFNDSTSVLDIICLALDVAETHLDIPEVGSHGRPNALGEVELDAGIMVGDNRCGAVAAVRGIASPSLVARWVMETGDHVLLAGEGAKDFALERGMKRERLLTSKYLLEAEQSLLIPAHSGHDTMGILVLDNYGHLACGVSTSGRAWRRAGRVGDVAIPGAGFWAEDGIAAAVATGIGELAMRDCLCFAVVEAIRRGATVQEATQEIIGRVKRRGRAGQLVVMALDGQGNVGVSSTEPGFSYALWELPSKVREVCPEW